MTSLEVFQRLARDIVPAGTDLATLDIADTQEVMDAVNLAIQDWFVAAPARYKKTTVSQVISGPVTVSLSMTAGASIVGGSPFSTPQRGCAVLIAGDAIANEITGPSSLLNDYRGSTGTQGATIWGDCIPLTDLTIERLATDPLVMDTGVTLRYAPNLWRNGKVYGLNFGNAPILPDPYVGNNVGQPRWYNTRQTGASQGADVIDLIHLYPRPDQAYTLQFDAFLSAVRLSLDAAATAVPLPIQDQFVLNTLLPIARGYLASHAGFRRPVPAALAAAKEAGMGAATARGLAQEINTPHHRIRTPRGW